MEHFELDRTDEEREELVKKWIKDYWLVVVASVLLAIAIVYGVHYYRQSVAEEKNTSAVEVQQVLSAIKSGQLDQAQTLVTALQKNSPESSYPVVATLALAKKYFANQSYPKAVAQYDWLIKTAGDTSIRDIARLRKARALVNAKQTSEALATLSTVEGRQNFVETTLLKGDVLLMDKQYEKALAAYQSIKSDSQVNVNADLVKQRIELVHIKQQANGKE